MSYQPNSENQVKNTQTSALRCYRIDEDATPAAIAKTGCDVVSYTDDKAHQPNIDAAAPTFTQLIRGTGLMATSSKAYAGLDELSQAVSPRNQAK